MKTLYEAILPWTPRLNEQGTGAAILQPPPEPMGNELGPVVATCVARSTTLSHQFVQGLQHVPTVHLWLYPDL